METILLDTNILIEILKGNQETISRVESINIIAISAISAMELYYGAFNKVEVNKLEKFMTLFEIIDFNEQISQTSTRLIKTYAKSHNLDIPDSLIASTALVNNYKLFTYNLKDFRYINGIELA